MGSGVSKRHKTKVIKLGAVNATGATIIEATFHDNQSTWDVAQSVASQLAEDEDAIRLAREGEAIEVSKDVTLATCGFGLEVQLMVLVDNSITDKTDGARAH